LSGEASYYAAAQHTVGAKVTISQGPYIGATAVKFNGKSAAFSLPWLPTVDSHDRVVDMMLM
jgi:hypothetical protein